MHSTKIQCLYLLPSCTLIIICLTSHLFGPKVLNLKLGLDTVLKTVGGQFGDKRYKTEAVTNMIWTEPIVLTSSRVVCCVASVSDRRDVWLADTVWRGLWRPEKLSQAHLQAPDEQSTHPSQQEILTFPSQHRIWCELTEKFSFSEKERDFKIWSHTDVLGFFRRRLNVAIPRGWELVKPCAGSAF